MYVNPDLVGVELCAAAKNVIGLAVGGVDGLGLGDNAKAALITRDYGYWVENQLRDRFELEGVPVSIDFVNR